MHKNSILTLLLIFIKLNCGPDSLQDNFQVCTIHLMKMLIILLGFIYYINV